MDDEGFDPCECMWNHDMAMQRLLSIVSHDKNKKQEIIV